MNRVVLLSILLAVTGAMAQLPAGATPQTPADAAQSAATSAAASAPGSSGFNTSAIPQEVTAPSKTFRTSTRIVVVDVVVTDKKGNPVHDLQRSDFHIFESGHEQQLNSFEERKSRGSAPLAQPVTDTGTTNAGQEFETPALNVILFDALDTAASDQSFARNQVKKVIAELPQGSRIAIFVLRNDLHMIQGFTTDTTALAAAMQKDQATLSGPWFNDPDTVLLSQSGDPSGSGAGAAASLGSTLSGDSQSGSVGTSYLSSTAQRDEEGLTSTLRTEKLMAAISALSRYLSVLPGRKNLLWLAGIFPFDLLPDTTGQKDAFRGNTNYDDPMHELAMRLEAGHVAVYPIDVRGLVDTGLFGAANHGRPTRDTVNAASGAQLSQLEVMEDIAHETGGRAIYNDNDIRGEIIESINQGSQFYSLTYSPEDKNWNGKYRKIEVRAPLKGAQLYYRHGYLADDPDANTVAASVQGVPKFSVAMLRGSPERAEVVMTIKAEPTGKYVEQKDRAQPVLRQRDEPVQATTPKPFQTHLKGTTEVYALACTIDAKTVTFGKNKDGLYVPRLALTFIAYDADGTVLNAETGFFNYAMSEAQYQAVLQRGITVNQSMEVPLGRAFLRIGVHDLQNEKVGTTEIPLIVTRPARAAK